MVPHSLNFQDASVDASETKRSRKFGLGNLLKNVYLVAFLTLLPALAGSFVLGNAFIAPNNLLVGPANPWLVIGMNFVFFFTWYLRSKTDWNMKTNLIILAIGTEIFWFAILATKVFPSWIYALCDHFFK